MQDAAALFTNVVEGKFSEYQRQDVHGLALWERKMANFPALELIANHKILEQ